jgi:hypothetical protein
MRVPVPGWLLLAAAAGAACVGPVTALVWPQINWDMLAYIGIVKSWSLSDPAAIQHAAYADALRFAHAMHDDPAGAALVGGNDYRRLMARDPASFLEAFGFYRIRPLYEVLLAVVARATPTVAQATVVISACAALIANLAVLAFARRRAGAVAGALLGMGFALSPVIVTVAGYSTADALGTCVVLLGVMALVSGRAVLGAAILAGSVGVRSDFMLMNAAMLGVLAVAWWRGWWRVPVAALALLAASIVAARAIEAWGGSFGYHVLYYNTFVQTLLHPAHPGPMPVPAHRWVTAILEGVHAGLANGAFSLPLLVALLVVAVLGAADLRDRAVLVFLALALALGGRILLFPSADVRLSAPIFGGVFVVLCAAIGTRRRLGAAWPPPRPPRP